MHSYVLVSNLILKISDSQNSKDLRSTILEDFIFNFMQFQKTNNLRLIYDTLDSSFLMLHKMAQSSHIN